MVTQQPRSFNLIERSDLALIVKKVVMGFNPPGTNLLRISESSLKNSLYSLVIEELKIARKYFKGLNLNLLFSILKEVTSGYIYEGDTKSPKDLMEEYDALCWKKVNEEVYDIARWKELHQRLNNGL